MWHTASQKRRWRGGMRGQTLGARACGTSTASTPRATPTTPTTAARPLALSCRPAPKRPPPAAGVPSCDGVPLCNACRARPQSVLSLDANVTHRIANPGVGVSAVVSGYRFAAHGAGHGMMCCYAKHVPLLVRTEMGECCRWCAFMWQCAAGQCNAFG